MDTWDDVKKAVGRWWRNIKDLLGVVGYVVLLVAAVVTGIGFILFLLMIPYIGLGAFLLFVKEIIL